jgi:hypothetical protein
MSVISEVLEQYDAPLSEEDVAQILRDALEAGGHRPSTGLTQDEKDFLVQHAGLTGYDPDHPDPHRMATARLEVEMSVLSRSLSTEALGERLGIDGSRVRHRYRDGSLYAVRVGRSLRFPLWQFDEDYRTIPGLSTVLAALPKDLHPAEVDGWMTSPEGNLAIDDQAVSVREWLLRGGDVGRVTELVDSIDRW